MKRLSILAFLVALFGSAGCEGKKSQEGRTPDIDVRVDPGKPPKFNAEAPNVDVGTKEKEIKPAAEAISLRLQPRQEIRRMVQYYRPIRIPLSEKPGEKLKAEPEYAAKKPLYGTMKLGLFRF